MEILPAEKNLGRVHYIVAWDVAREHSAILYLVSEAPHTSVDDAVYRKALTKNCQVQMQPPEQRSATLLKDYIRRFSIPGDKAFEAFARKLSTAKTCFC